MKEIIKDFINDFKESFGFLMGFMFPIILAVSCICLMMFLGRPYEELAEKDKIIKHTYNTTFNTYEEYIVWRYGQIEEKGE